MRRFDILWVRIFPGKNQRGDRVSSQPAKFSVRWALNDRTVARTTNAYLHPHRLQPLEAVNRPQGPQAWKVDFAAKRAAAVEAATPLWQRAESERNAAIALGKPIRELEQAVQAAANGQKTELQDRLKALKSEQQAHEQAAKSVQAEGDALYWPIYNLDLKNPNAKAGLEHADPKDLIAVMRSHEAEVMRLLGEIEALVGVEGGE